MSTAKPRRSATPRGGRPASIDLHPRRAEIIHALVRGEGYRKLSERFGVSVTALHRFLKDKLLDRAAATREALAVRDADYVWQQLERSSARLSKLYDALDRWLTDPSDPSRYSMDITHPDDIVVAYDVAGGTEAKPTRKTVKVRLSELLPLLEDEDLRSDVRLVEHRRKDPRELLLATAAQVERHLALISAIEGRLKASLVFEWGSPAMLDLQEAVDQALRGIPGARRRFTDSMAALAARGDTP